MCVLNNTIHTYPHSIEVSVWEIISTLESFPLIGCQRSPSTFWSDALDLHEDHAQHHEGIAT